MRDDDSCVRFSPLANCRYYDPANLDTAKLALFSSRKASCSNLSVCDSSSPPSYLVRPRFYSSTLLVEPPSNGPSLLIVLVTVAGSGAQLVISAFTLICKDSGIFIKCQARYQVRRNPKLLFLYARAQHARVQHWQLDVYV